MKNFKFKSGENLSYDDFGSDFKDVLVYHHPLMIFPQNTLINFCDKNQIRLILIYRSGHFNSSLFSADDSFLKFALRLKEFFSALNLGEFSVLGESVGAAYAYATAVAWTFMRRQRSSLISNVMPSFNRRPGTLSLFRQCS